MNKQTLNLLLYTYRSYSCYIWILENVSYSGLYMVSTNIHQMILWYMLLHPHIHTRLKFSFSNIKWFYVFLLLIIILDIIRLKNFNDVLNLCICDFKLRSYNRCLISAYSLITPLKKSLCWCVQRKITVKLNSLKMASGDAELRQHGNYCVIWHAQRSTQILGNKVMTCKWWWNVVCYWCKRNNAAIIFSGTKFSKYEVGILSSYF